SFVGQREDRGLPKEVHGRRILGQICKDWSERLARVHLLRRFRILGVHVHDEVRIWSEERHLAFRIATIGAVRVGFDELSNSEAVRRLAGRDGDVLAHESASLRLKYGAGFEKRLDPVSAIFTAE